MNEQFFKANLRWFKNKNDDSIISCVTHTEDVQLWHTTDSTPYSIIPRDTISNSMNVSIIFLLILSFSRYYNFLFLGKT